MRKIPEWTPVCVYSEAEREAQHEDWQKLREQEEAKSKKPDKLIKEAKTSSGERTVKLVKTWERGGVTCGKWWPGKWVHAVIMNPPSFKGCQHEEVGTRRKCEDHFTLLVNMR